ncbi:hypothetical protein T4D_8374 [Trichinella pseudospiralis]|uniref:Uncharacterized protein n=1 Tax=Trichinella pseudospiralis TaxID=6337 RepID=A0A0V1FGS8_TRIPS|nr:hypothetical protein T4D_8374 [Trichinella pseudospiralis]
MCLRKPEHQTKCTVNDVRSDQQQVAVDGGSLIIMLRCVAVFQWSNSEAPANSWAAVFNGTTHHHLPPPPSSTTAKSYKTLANRLLFSLSFNDDHDHDLMTLFVYNDDDHDHQFCKIQKWSYITYKFCNELHEFAIRVQRLIALPQQSSSSSSSN